MSLRKLFQAVFPSSSENNSADDHSASINIERIAINQDGCLGSVYDGYTDNIEGKMNTKHKSTMYKSINQTRCVLTQDDKLENWNLLKLVDIDHQLRLSILLKMVRATGIASFVDYPPLIDIHTRLLYVYHESYIESYGDHLNELKKPLRKTTGEIYGTHIITEIVRGVHLLVVLQLSPILEEYIDNILAKICSNLNNNEHAIELNSNERALLNQIILTKVYSNMDELTKIEKFENVYDLIIELRKNHTNHRPIKYILTPIRWFYPQYERHTPILIACGAHEIENLEYHLIQQSRAFKELSHCINHDLPELLQGKLQDKLGNIQSELLILRTIQGNYFTQIHELIWKARTGDVNYNTIDNGVNKDLQEKIRQLIITMRNHVEELKSKAKLFKLLQSDGFEYCDVVEFGIEERLKEDRIKDMLLGNDSHKLIFFSNDTLRNQDKESWTIIYSEMIEERRKNPQLHLVYADFTNSTYTLKKMTMERLTESLVNDNQSNSKLTRSIVKRNAPSPPTSLPVDKCINILLVGESGVGKSTFINAFANYLHFQSLQEAQQGKPIVIIPVSYVMTINDDFDERIIKFGEIDPNENHNDIGQSVTQQCKSYVFNISNQTKLRIIDTPGFGDTRGNEQDDLNMEEIFSFLNNFTHLNGICLLFKPESTQLNGYFRSCCTQLFDYFGENIRDHLIFCFTNARSTFYAPGNTRPLLQAFFNCFPVKNIPFEKSNTFCFDSESFRYLVAIQNGIEFDPSEKGEFEQSWTKSVTESKRFDEFLCHLDAYRKKDKWQSIKDVEFQIHQMIRPMLEAMRNLLRNWILYNLGSSIELHAIPTESSSMICYACSRQNLEKVGSFWILTDHLHHPPNMCPSNDQKPTEYRLQYEFLSNQVEESVDDIQRQLKYLSEICAKLSYFLMKNSQTILEDPFLVGIDRMINEEQFICEAQTSSYLNKMLIENLNYSKKSYKECLERIKSSREELNLLEIYDLIEGVNNISTVKIQFDAIRNYQQRLVEKNQRTVVVDETSQNLISF